MKVVLALAAAGILLAAGTGVAPPPSTAGGPVPFTPQHVREEKNASVTAPCCAYAFAAANASDPDDSDLYDVANATAATNGTWPQSVYVPVLRERVPLPNATWYARANASAWDSTTSDSFDRFEFDAHGNFTYTTFTQDRWIVVSCIDAQPAVPGPETCTATWA